MRQSGPARRQLRRPLRPPGRILYMVRPTTTRDLAGQLGCERLTQVRERRVTVDLHRTPQAARERATLYREVDAVHRGTDVDPSAPRAAPQVGDHTSAVGDEANQLRAGPFGTARGTSPHRDRICWFTLRHPGSHLHRRWRAPL